MTTDRLLPEIPEVIRGAEIGRCFNSRTRTLLETSKSFQPEKLSQKGLLHFIDGSAELESQANATSSSFARNSFFGLSAAATAGWGVKVNGGFNMATAEQSARSSHEINCYVQYIYSGQVCQLYDAQAVEYFNCMSPQFQDNFTNLMNATSVEGYVAAYREFLRHHGDGCITKLYLVSGSACRISIRREGAERARSEKYGASLALNSSVGSASVATDWGKAMAAARSNAVMETRVEYVPPSTPTRQWVQEIHDLYYRRGIEFLADPANAPKAPAIDHPVLPPVPKLEPSTKELPKPKIDKKKQQEVSEKIIQDMMKEDGFVGDLAAYKEAQAKQLEALTAKNVVEEAREIERRYCREGRTPAPRLATVDAPLVASGELGADYGSYLPVQYEITRWDALFEDLRLDLPTTLSGIFHARRWMFFLTRLEFSQYLAFLADVGGWACGNGHIAQDAEFFADFYERFFEREIRRINSEEPFTNEDYQNMVAQFHGDLRKEREFDASRQIYDGFFEHYGLLKDQQLGFIHLWRNPPGDESGDLFYTRDAGFRAVPGPLRVSMSGDALRLYPVVTNDGKLNLVRFLGDFTLHRGDVSYTVVDDDPTYGTVYQWHTDDADASPIDTLGLGLDEVHRRHVFGAPMFEAHPFDEAREGAEWSP